jgi:hypothetical protein
MFNQTAAHGIYIESGGGVGITNCLVQATTDSGVSLIPSGAGVLNGVTITGCWFEQAGNGDGKVSIDIGDATNGVIGVAIHGNRMTAPGYTAGNNGTYVRARNSQGISIGPNRYIFSATETLFDLDNTVCEIFESQINTWFNNVSVTGFSHASVSQTAFHEASGATPTLSPWGSTELNGSLNAVAATLGSGTVIGQTKTIVCIDATNPITVTVADHERSSPEVFTFSEVGQCLVLRWTGVEWVTQYDSQQPDIYFGTGSPEGVVTAPVGSLYIRTDGGSGTTLYVKESGAGNTGWVGK